MKIGNYEIIKQTNNNYLITKRNKSTSIQITDEHIASSIGVTTLSQLKKQTKKWRYIKKYKKDIKIDYLFVKFMYYSGRWIIIQSPTEKEFLENKIDWYTLKDLEIITVILGMIMTKCPDDE